MKLPANYVMGEGQKKASGFGGFGQRLMESMGWEKGEGLGKDKSGMKEALQAKKKENQLGVGATESGVDWAIKHWEVAYETQASKIVMQTVCADGSSSSSSDDESSNPRGRRSVKLHRDGTTASGASDAELKIAAALAKDPWGRWGGRSGKHARMKAQEEKDAAAANLRLVGTAKPLNLSSSRNIAAPTSETAQHKNSRRASSESAEAAGVDSDSEKPSKKKKKKHSVQPDPTDSEDKSTSTETTVVAPPPVKRIIIHCQDTQPQLPAVPFVRTPETGWWGARYFRSTGPLAGMEEEVKGLEEDGGSSKAAAAAAVPASELSLQGRKGFTEDEQTAVYMAAHEAQRVGKKGLGQGTATLKFAGGNWEGSKLVFVDDGSAAATAAGAAAALEYLHEGREGADGEGGSSPAEAEAPVPPHTPSASQPSWLKLSKSILKKMAQKPKALTISGKVISLGQGGSS
ncbi:MAG: hypothetical protein WDW38_003456 [Sanguina aurantia]